MIAYLLSQEIAALFIMMGAGFVLVRFRFADATAAKALSAATIYVLMPASIIRSFLRPFSEAVRDGLMLSVLAAAVVHAMMFAVVRALKRPLGLAPIERASLIYTNAANLIFPLVASVIGPDFVIYASGYICVQIIFMWTHAKSLVQGRAEPDIKKILLNSNVVACVVGLALFFSGARPPSVVASALGSLASSIGAISMMAIGMVIATTDLRAIFSRPRVYAVAALRMLALPSIALAIFKLTPLASLAPNGKTILLISLLAASGPTATAITQMAQLYGRDPEYAGSINVLTTLTSVVTMPIVVWMYSM